MAFDWKGPFFVLSSAEVHVIVTEAKTIEQIRQTLEKMGTLQTT
jgi:hypothetical protein